MDNRRIWSSYRYGATQFRDSVEPDPDELLSVVRFLAPNAWEFEDSFDYVAELRAHMAKIRSGAE